MRPPGYGPGEDSRLLYSAINNGMRGLLKVVVLTNLGKMKGKTKDKKTKEENIWNVPNTLTFIRVIVTFVIIFSIFAHAGLVTIAILFIIGMITDFLDGQIARRFNMVTEFGRKFDMIADRMLMVSTAVALIFYFNDQGLLGRDHILQIILILSREIIAFPFAIVAFVANRPIPHARFIGKLTTFMQGVTLPAILLSTTYAVFNFSIYLAILTSLIGAISAFTYVNDLRKEGVE